MYWTSLKSLLGTPFFSLITSNSDSGLILKNGAMGSVYAPSDDNFILTGTYTTS